MKTIAKISVTVDLVYKNRQALRSTYDINWDSAKREFEPFMEDLMNTIIAYEEPGTLDRIDIINIVAVSATLEEKKCIKDFLKSLS